MTTPTSVTEELFKYKGTPFCIITNTYTVSPEQILPHVLKATVLCVVSLSPE